MLIFNIMALLWYVMIFFNCFKCDEYDFVIFKLTVTFKSSRLLMILFDSAYNDVKGWFYIPDFKTF